MANQVVFVLPLGNVDKKKEEEDDADNEKALLLAGKVVASLVARFGPAAVVDWELLQGQADDTPCCQVDFAKRLHAELAVLQADTFGLTVSSRAGGPNADTPPCCRVDFVALPVTDQQDAPPEQEAIMKRSQSFDDVLEYCWHGENCEEGILSLISYGDDVNANDSPVKAALAQLGRWATKVLTGEFELEAWMQEGIEIAGQQCDNVITASKTKLMDYALLVEETITEKLSESLLALGKSGGTAAVEDRLKEVEDGVGAVVRGLRTTSSVLEAPVVLLANVHKVLGSISGISAQAIMEGWVARIERLVTDGLSDAFEEAYLAIETQIKAILGTGSQITEGLDEELFSTVKAFSGRISVWQRTLYELCGKYPEIVEELGGAKMRALVKDCFELVQNKAASAILGLIEVLRGNAKLDDSMIENLRVGVLALFEGELPLQIDDAQTVSSLAR